MPVKYLRYAAISVMAVMMIGCAFDVFDQPAQPVSRKRTLPLGIAVEMVSVDREEFRQTLANPAAVNSVRLVEIYQGESESEPLVPRYRVFGVRFDSPYYLLGLRNGDILLSASGYIISEASKFKPYVSLLGNEKQVEIEVVREQQGLLLRCQFEE